jgi:hypothetical protein
MLIDLDPQRFASLSFETGHRNAPSLPAPLKSVLNRLGPGRVVSARSLRLPWEAGDFGPIMPVQYYANLASSRVPTGERKLLFAVLEDALRCYVLGKSRHSPAHRAEFLEARYWFLEKSSAGVFSFESVCAILDIDPNCVRVKLDFLEPADMPLQHFCNRRRLSGGKSKASRDVSGAVRDLTVNTLAPRTTSLYADRPSGSNGSLS